MSYRTLEVWALARTVSKEVHQMTLTKLPKFEMFEQGSQIRRSAHSIRANIVEGYGRRRYKQDFVKHLTYSLASCDETIDHLESLLDTESLRERALYDRLHTKLEDLHKGLTSFLHAVERGHQSVK